MGLYILKKSQVSLMVSNEAWFVSVETVCGCSVLPVSVTLYQISYPFSAEAVNAITILGHGYRAKGQNSMVKLHYTLH